MRQNTGKVAQIIGAVVDITFENVETGLPDIYDSLEIEKEDGNKLKVTSPRELNNETQEICFSLVINDG